MLYKHETLTRRVVLAGTNGTRTITTDWSELDKALPPGSSPRQHMKCDVRDLYVGKDLGPAMFRLSAEVGEEIRGPWMARRRTLYHAKAQALFEGGQVEAAAELGLAAAQGM